MSTSTDYKPRQQDLPAMPAGFDRALGWAADLLARYSVDVLRISLGIVFFAFGVLKFFPGVSPAQDLVIRTIEKLTFGVLSGETALLVTAITECFIGVTFVSGKLLRTGLVVLGGALVGIMSPLVLFPGDLFPGGVPTLEAQYVFKDIVLAAAGLVVAAKALGVRMVQRRPA
ncbi:DoxX family membrane protein [Flindersiella endophytica]